MQTKFKRHQKVRILIDPDPEYIEYYIEGKPPIIKGMTGKINILLQNGNYHVEVIDKKTKQTIAYITMPEEYLESAE